MEPGAPQRAVAATGPAADHGTEIHRQQVRRRTKNGLGAGSTAPLFGLPPTSQETVQQDGVMAKIVALVWDESKAYFFKGDKYVPLTTSPLDLSR
jgi:hypothetical protein